MMPRDFDGVYSYEVGGMHPFRTLLGSNSQKTNELPKKVKFDEVNGATILYWEDGTKTVVRKCKDNVHDRRVAFLTAYFQKHCGLSKTQANKYIASLKEDKAKE
ncbi:MAG: hypothetical protein IJX99_09335 [Clostridia bacterium]|nr:hypothetical protein [Clostridia bacterium]